MQQWSNTCCQQRVDVISGSGAAGGGGGSGASGRRRKRRRRTLRWRRGGREGTSEDLKKLITRVRFEALTNIEGMAITRMRISTIS